MRIAAATLTIAFARAIASAEPSAEEIYEEGQAAYDRGDFATAIARWQSSYELSKQPLLVLNVAQAYRLAGDCPRALSTYQQYVTLDPASEQRSLADGFIAELSAQCGRRTEAVKRVEQPSDTRSRTGGDTRIAGLVTGGVGVAVLATGLVFGRRAVALGDEVTRDCATACDWSVEKTKERDGKRYAAIGKVLDVAGVAAIAAGIGLYIYGARDREPALAIQPRSTGATVSWSGTW